MPELPEVETVVRDLRPLLVGQRIVDLQVGRLRLRKAWSRAWHSLVVNQAVLAVERRGKWILVRLENGATLVIHLGMTGQLRVHATNVPLENHTHLRFRLPDDRELRFRDIRRFGSATVHVDEAALQELFKELGPEPWELETGYWQSRLAGTDRNLKAVLLDQRIVAGVGNIYADESLFQAKLHPARIASQLERFEASRLRKAIVGVLERAIEQRGSSIRNYVGGSGLKGNYQQEFRVYGQTDKPCPRCRTPIERVRLAGRSTHFCPACQT